MLVPAMSALSALFRLHIACRNFGLPISFLSLTAICVLEQLAADLTVGIYLGSEMAVDEPEVVFSASATDGTVACLTANAVDDDTLDYSPDQSYIFITDGGGDYLTGGRRGRALFLLGCVCACALVCRRSLNLHAINCQAAVSARGAVRLPWFALDR